MTETAAQAQARVINPLLEKIRESVQLPAYMLPPGCTLKIGGQYVTFEGMQDGAMVLSTSSAGFMYTPGTGEIFSWRWPVTF